MLFTVGCGDGPICKVITNFELLIVVNLLSTLNGTKSVSIPFIIRESKHQVLTYPCKFQPNPVNYSLVRLTHAPYTLNSQDMIR